MTRENAIEKVKKILSDAGLSEVIKISNSCTKGETQCVDIEPFPLKGNSEIVKKLKAIPNFYGYKSTTLEGMILGRRVFEFCGCFRLNE